MADLLLSLYQERQITLAELEAGRQWQFWFGAACIQPFRSFDWGAPIRTQAVFQRRGELSDHQADAMANRAMFRKVVGRFVADMLDIVLRPEATRRELVAIYGRGVLSVIEWLPRPLKLLALAFNIQSYGADDGYHPAPPCWTERDRSRARLKVEQPILFTTHRRQGKLSAAHFNVALDRMRANA